MAIFSRLARSYLAVALLWLGITISPTALANDAVPVRVAVVQEQSIKQALQLTGSVTSKRSARLSTSIAGLVTAMHVDAGSKVNAGDVMLELDAELAELQWRGSNASVASARLALADARRRLSEARALAPKQSIAETVIRDLAAEVEADEAALQRAQADAGYRKGILDRHVLYAPFTGLVSAKQTELGEWVSPGQPVLALVATEDLQIDFQLSEDYVSAVGPNTELSYTLGDNTNDAQKGTIETLVAVADPSARTFLLRVKPADLERSISPGMSARAVLNLDSGRRGVAISRDAIIKYPDGRVVVWLVDTTADGDVVTEKRVHAGLVFGDMVEIRDGLKANTRVVVEGNESLRPGQRVRVLSGAQR